MTATRPPTALQITRRGALSAAWGTWIAASTLHSVMAQEAAAVRMQLDQQALNAVPGDERVGLEVTEDTSPAAQRLKAHSSPGKALPIIYLIAGVLRFPRSVVRYRRCFDATNMAEWLLTRARALRTFETT